MGFLLRLVVTAVALWVATLVVPGLTVTGGSAGKNALTLLVVALIFGVVNAVLKPIIRTIGCIFYILTLGLIALVVNALLFMLTAWIAERLDLPFRVHDFGAAFWGALIVGVVSWAINLFLPDRSRYGSSRTR